MRFCYLKADHQIWFFPLYEKNEAMDLTSGEQKMLKRAIQAELEARRSNRPKIHHTVRTSPSHREGSFFVVDEGKDIAFRSEVNAMAFFKSSCSSFRRS